MWLAVQMQQGSSEGASHRVYLAEMSYAETSAFRKQLFFLALLLFSC